MQRVGRHDAGGEFEPGHVLADRRERDDRIPVVVLPIQNVVSPGPSALALFGHHTPRSVRASSGASGQDGTVTATTRRPLAPARNWNDVPSGMVRQTPGPRVVVSSWPFRARHTCPLPPIRYQISSTVACETA